LGKIDAIEMPSEGPSCAFVEKYWYTFQSAGCRVPLVGAGQKTCNAELLGGWRTYARLRPGEELTYHNWIEAVRAGRVFLTNGPLLFFTVDGQDPGAVIALLSLDQPVHIAAEARSLVPLETLELIVNGQVYQKVEATCPTQSLSLSVDAKLPAAGWLALRCSGPRVFPEPSLPQRYAAQTSPIYVQVGGRPPRPDQKHLAALLTELDKVLSWAGAVNHAGNGRWHTRVVQILDSARKLLVERGVT
jgi:TolB protein